MTDTADVVERDPSASEHLGLVLDLLTLERRGENEFRGARKPGGRGRVFGGQVIAQALVAARATVEAERPAHSLHAYFMRPGSEDHPVDYTVERDRDGGSFSSRRVLASQDGVPILSMAAGFHRDEGGATHHLPMPEVPPPEELLDETALYARDIERIPERMRRWVTRPRPIEQRPVDPILQWESERKATRSATWFRAAGPLPDATTPDGRDLHRALLAYASDTRLLDASMLAHGWSFWERRMQVASLDHALWLHEDVALDQWNLYVTDSPWTGHGRGMNRGLIYARDGRLIATVAQEGLVRRREGSNARTD